MKCKINANEINALKEKRVRLISEIELLRVGADLLSVKAEKLHDFLLSHTIEPTEKAFWRDPERSDWTTKNGGKSQQEVSKKCYLFIGLSVSYSRKKLSIVAFLNKLTVFVSALTQGSIFCVQNPGKPIILCIVPLKILEFSWKKRWKIQKNTLGNPSKPRNLNLKFAWQPWFLTCVWPFYRLQAL